MYPGIQIVSMYLKKKGGNETRMEILARGT